MDLALLWFQLAGAALAILFTSKSLARSTDIIAFKTGLGRTFVGVVMLATATSLPELATGVSSVTLVGEPDIAAGNAFGATLSNLFIIGLLDIFWRRGPILNAVGPSPLIVAALGLAIISLSAAGIVIHGLTPVASGWFISPFSVLMLGVFIASIYITYRVELGRANANNDDAESANYDDVSGIRAAIRYLISAGIIVGAAIWLAETGDRLAQETGWDASFIGTQFIAAITTLPELATSFAAIRLNAPELAMSNLLGSNLFNMGFITVVDDLAFSGGVFWAAVSEIHVLTALAGVFMTSVVMLAMVVTRRRRPGKHWTIEAAVLITLYFATNLLIFNLS